MGGAWMAAAQTLGMPWRGSRSLAWLNRRCPRAALPAVQLPLMVPRHGPAAMPGSSVDCCRVALVFAQLLVGIVVPSLFVAKFHAHAAVAAVAPVSTRRSQNLGDVAVDGTAGVQKQGRSWSPLLDAAAGRLVSMCGRCGSGARRAAATAEAGLLHLCHVLSGAVDAEGSQAASALLTGTAWMLLLALLWASAIALEPPASLMRHPATSIPAVLLTPL